MQQYAPGAQGGIPERWLGTGWRWSRWWSLMMTKLPLDSESPGRFHWTQIFRYISMIIYNICIEHIVPLWKFALWFLMFSVDTGIPFVSWRMVKCPPYRRAPLQSRNLHSLLYEKAEHGVRVLWLDPKFSKNSPKSQKIENAITFWAGFHLPMISDWMVFSHQSSWLP